MAALIRDTNVADEAELKALARGDERALGGVYDRHAGPVFSLATYMLRDRSEAEEVTQDVFLALWRHPERYDASRGSLRVYLLQLTRGRALDRLRRRSRRAQLWHLAHPELEPTEDPPGPYDEQVDRDRRVALRSALGELSDGQSQALLLFYFEGLTHKEIAAELELPMGTVKTHLRRGLMAIREALAKIGHPEVLL